MYLHDQSFTLLGVSAVRHFNKIFFACVVLASANSFAATVFVMISVVLSALEIRHHLPIAISLYLQILAIATVRAYVIDYRNFDVYREDPIAT